MPNTTQREREQILAFLEKQFASSGNPVDDFIFELVEGLYDSLDFEPTLPPEELDALVRKAVRAALFPKSA